MWTQARLLLWEQSNLGLHCFVRWASKTIQKVVFVVIGALRVKFTMEFNYNCRNITIGLNIGLIRINTKFKDFLGLYFCQMLAKIFFYEILDVFNPVA